MQNGLQAERSMDENELAAVIVDSALAVHTALGAGLLESAYETCLAYELASRDLNVRRQVVMPVRYKQVRLDLGYRLDLLVGEKVVVEVKAIKHFAPIHTAQLLSYLKLSGYRLGILLNFHTPHMRLGIKRIANSR
jgi:GxxExxY protein